MDATQGNTEMIGSPPALQAVVEAVLRQDARPEPAVSRRLFAESDAAYRPSYRSGSIAQCHWSWPGA